MGTIWGASKRDVDRITDRLDRIERRLDDIDEYARVLRKDVDEVMQGVGPAEMLELQEATMRTVEKVNALLARLRKYQLDPEQPAIGAASSQSNGEHSTVSEDPKRELYRRSAAKKGQRYTS